MDSESKRKQLERYLKHAKKQRTFEEEKQIREHSRERKRSRRSSGREGRAWDEDPEDEELESFERISKARRLDTIKKEDPNRVDPQVLVPKYEGEPGQILSVSRGRATVGLGEQEVSAVLAPWIAAAQQTVLAVGDEVSVQMNPGEEPRVVAVAPRRTCLSRPDPQNPHRERVIAANVDVAVIVLAARRPPLKPRLIDRVMLQVERGGASPIICITKLDLDVDVEERVRIEAVLAPYREIGVPALLTSSVTGEGLGDLHDELEGKTAVFIGHSGVGKSTLLNALEPRVQCRTGDVRAYDGRGRHTTTWSTLYEVGESARVIDTPGIRSFGLWQLSAEEVREAFPEFRARAGDCRFRDCSHRQEPQCAVRAAVEAGEISPARWDTYHRILESLDQDAS